MDPIKEAFSKAKEDINALKSQFETLSVDVLELKSLLSELNQHIKAQQAPSKQINPTDKSELTEPIANDPDFWAHKALKPHIYTISTRNEGVPTDRQTDQQTNTYSNNPPISPGKTDIGELLNSLDTYKKELRNKFKKLTKQEMLIFTTLYQLEEEGFVVDYPLISKKLSLSESSIRDYVQRIIKKDIPLDKIKENNKKIYLKIPSELKKMASISTLLQLREL